MWSQLASATPTTAPTSLKSVGNFFFLLLSKQKLNSLKALCCWPITTPPAALHTIFLLTHFVPLLLVFTTLQVPSATESFQHHPFQHLPCLPPPVYSPFSSPVSHPFLRKILPWTSWWGHCCRRSCNAFSFITLIPSRSFHSVCVITL